MLYYAVTFFLLAALTGAFGLVAATGVAVEVAWALCFLFAMFFAMSVFFWRWRP